MIIHRVDVPTAPPDRPTVYVVVQAQWGSDVSGSLLLPDGELVWGHMSSNIDWLVNDLTISFAHRRLELEARVGTDIDVAVVEAWADAPEWLRKLNNDYAAVAR